MQWLEMLNLDPYLLQVLALDLVLVIPLLWLLALLSGRLNRRSIRAELATEDNHALGIALSGSVIALFLVLGATVQGQAALTLIQEASLVVVYGIASMLLVRLGLSLQDWLILRDIDLQQQIQARNNAAAIVEASSAISIGLLMMAALKRIDSQNFTGLWALLAGFILAQLMLTLVTLMHQYHQKRSSAIELQSLLLAGNQAVALRFAGRIIACALVVNAAGSLVMAEDSLLSLALWMLATLILMLIQQSLAWLVRRLLLAGIDQATEINHQANIAIASLDLAVSLGVSLLLNALLS